MSISNILSIMPEGLSTDKDTISLPITLFLPSIPTHKEYMFDMEQLILTRIMDNVYKQSYNFNLHNNVVYIKNAA